MTPKQYPAFLDLFKPSFWREVRKEWKENNSTPEGKEKLRKQYENLSFAARFSPFELSKLQVEAKKTHLLVVMEIIEQFLEGKMSLSQKEIDGLRAAVQKYSKQSSFPDKNNSQHLNGECFINKENLAK